MIFLLFVALLSTQQAEALLDKKPPEIANNLTGIFYEESTRAYPANCAEATALSHKSGLYTIQVKPFIQMPFVVYCEAEIDGGGWTVVQRRESGHIDFYRNWREYKVGFGSLYKEFWLGLDKLHALTTSSVQELLIVMEDFDSQRKFAKYEAFAIGDEQEQYALKVLGEYTGDAGDSLRYHESMKFTTFDVTNNIGDRNCAIDSHGAWWYGLCHFSNLNGRYLNGRLSESDYQKGIIWYTFRGIDYSLKYVTMMIRPRRS